MKRAQSQTNHATASGTVTGNGTPTATDIMSSPLVLQHELRHVKVRLRERSLAFEELSQLHHEHMKAMKQQTLYVKKLEEAWANMELALQALVPDKNLPSSSAHASSTTSSFPSDNPILAMFSNRWCELSGRSREEMQSEMKAFSKKLDNRMADVDEEEDEEDEEEDETRKEKDLSNELKYSLDQRIEFSRSLLESVLTHLRSPPSSEPDSAARIALLEAANLQLQQRIHSNTNELILLNTALSSRDQRIESLEDKNAMLTRKLERLKEDVESGKVAAAAAAAQRAENEAAASANQASTVKVEMGENGSIKLEDSAAMKYSALTAKAATIPDSRPFKSEELGELSTIFPSTANSPTPIVVTTLDVLQLREELADYKSLADRRQDQLKQLKEQKTQLERDLDLARMRILQDDQAIRGTKLFQSLSKSFEQTNHNLHRLQYEFETVQTRLQEEHRNRQQLELDHNNCLQRGEALYEQSLAKATNEIESLKSTILQLQHEREEWLSAHITDVELNSFFQKMRTEIIPSLDKQLREFTTFMTQYKADKENVQQLQSNGAGNETVHFARVMRVWKQQEIALKAELEVFRNAVKESSDPTSSSSSTCSSPSSTRTAALEAENAALKSELDSFLSSDSNTLHLQLSQAKELSQVLGEELNSVSASHEEVQLSAAKLTTTIAEYTRSLDKFRHEKVQTTKLLNSLRQESLALKSKLDLCDQSSSLHSKVARDAKLVASEAQKESARLRDELHQLTVSLDQERAIQSHQQQLSAEYKTKFMQLCNQHETCEKTIEELRERESEHSSSYHRIAEQFILLKGRFASLRSSAGLSKKSKSSESSSSSGDADVIKSLKLLINCRVCESKQKSKVIVKCMHAFCADCIQSNLDTRLRKCPQCGLKFGESDVKSLYL